jgi:hypothetical protein
MILTFAFRKAATALAIALGIAASHEALAWSGYNQVTIKLLTVYQASQGAGAGALIELPTPFPNDTEGCSQSSHGYAWIDFSSSTQPDGKSVYATVLATRLAGRAIGIG